MLPGFGKSALEIVFQTKQEKIFLHDLVKTSVWVANTKPLTPLIYSNFY